LGISTEAGAQLVPHESLKAFRAPAAGIQQNVSRLLSRRRLILKLRLSLATLAWVALGAATARAQSLPTPAMTGPLQTASPFTFDAGPLGKLDVTGIVSGMGLLQGNHVAGDDTSQWDLSNGQVFIQKVTGWWQFYLQAGAYNIPALAAPFISTADTLGDFFGPVPVGYIKLAPSKNFSILVGKLPTLIGAETTFTFQNMNIERGLLWNQENDVNRGVQLNDTLGRFTASLSWNDGFYSNRFTWLTGSVSYAFNSANTLALVAGGNLAQTAFRNLATPVQNNSSIYNVIYTYSKGPWLLMGHWQYTDVPTDRMVGIAQGAATSGEMFMVNFNFKHHLSLAGRGEYISSTGSAARQTVNLLFGPGSDGWSFTVTPTYQNHGFFLRADFSYVQALHETPGDAFGPLGMNRSQPRAVLETGLMF
jgi:hypothetical protein